jgi:hypothetical protein
MTPVRRCTQAEITGAGRAAANATAADRPASRTTASETTTPSRRRIDGATRSIPHHLRTLV